LSGELYTGASLFIQSFIPSIAKGVGRHFSLKIIYKKLENAGYLVQGLGTNEISKLTYRKAPTNDQAIGRNEGKKKSWL
jgi:hypothetical protein